MRLHLLTSVICSICIGTYPLSLSAGTNDTIIAGVHIYLDATDPTFPDSWMTPPTNAHAELIDPSEMLRSKEILNHSLAKYTASLLQKELNAVFVLKSMDFFGVGYGGTNSLDVVYLTNNGIPNGYTSAYIEQTFHHEFSSILIRNHPDLIDRTTWERISGEGNQDPEGGVGAIRNGTASTWIDTALCAYGFLTQYSLSDFENDVNMIAQNLFMPYSDFWATVDQYPLIRKKVNMLIHFYSSLDENLTESYFRSLQWN